MNRAQATMNFILSAICVILMIFLTRSSAENAMMYREEQRLLKALSEQKTELNDLRWRARLAMTIEEMDRLEKRQKLPKDWVPVDPKEIE